MDGDLSDPGWQEAARVDVFYETNVGDNVPPPVKTVARIGYDSRFFYMAFRCDDPEPNKIRAPFIDRDNVFSEQDFAGAILDVKNDRRSALELFVNARGIQDDGVINDATGNEDFSPDLFWQSAGRIDAGGWQVEVAIPLSSLRYPEGDPQKWAILLYRNYPRDRRYQMFQARLPRGSNCLLCHAETLEGITGLPQGQHIVAAPYAAGANTKTYPGSGAYSGTGDNDITKGKVGLDVKWTPDADTIVNGTVNPDVRREPSLWIDPVSRRDGSFAGSALFSYKLNWQTVLFLGYGDNRTLVENGDLVRADRQVFLKVSYAFQR